MPTLRDTCRLSSNTVHYQWICPFKLCTICGLVNIIIINFLLYFISDMGKNVYVCVHCILRIEITGAEGILLVLIGIVKFANQRLHWFVFHHWLWKCLFSHLTLLQWYHILLCTIFLNLMLFNLLCGCVQVCVCGELFAGVYRMCI